MEVCEDRSDADNAQCGACTPTDYCYPMNAIAPLYNGLARMYFYWKWYWTPSSSHTSCPTFTFEACCCDPAVGDCQTGGTDSTCTTSADDGCMQISGATVDSGSGVQTFTDNCARANSIDLLEKNSANSCNGMYSQNAYYQVYQDLSPNVKWSFRTKAVGSSDESYWSQWTNPREAYKSYSDPPAATNIVCTPAGTGLSISWDRPSSGLLDDGSLVNSCCDSTQLKSRKSSDNTELTFTETSNGPRVLAEADGLTPGETYTFSVRGHSAAGTQWEGTVGPHEPTDGRWGAWSTWSTECTMPGPPVIDSSSMDVTWNWATREYKLKYAMSSDWGAYYCAEGPDCTGQNQYRLRLTQGFGFLETTKDHPQSRCLSGCSQEFTQLEDTGPAYRNAEASEKGEVYYCYDQGTPHDKERDVCIYSIPQDAPQQVLSVTLRVEYSADAGNTWTYGSQWYQFWDTCDAGGTIMARDKKSCVTCTRRYGNPSDPDNISSSTYRNAVCNHVDYPDEADCPVKYFNNQPTVQDAFLSRNGRLGTCQICSACPAGKVVSVPCTATSDAVCRDETPSAAPSSAPSDMIWPPPMISGSISRVNYRTMRASWVPGILTHPMHPNVTGLVVRLMKRPVGDTGEFSPMNLIVASDLTSYDWTTGSTLDVEYYFQLWTCTAETSAELCGTIPCWAQCSNLENDATSAMIETPHLVMLESTAPSEAPSSAPTNSPAPSSHPSAAPSTNFPSAAPSLFVWPKPLMSGTITRVNHRTMRASWESPAFTHHSADPVTGIVVRLMKRPVGDTGEFSPMNLIVSSNLTSYDWTTGSTLDVEYYFQLWTCTAARLCADSTLPCWSQCSNLENDATSAMIETPHLVMLESTAPSAAPSAAPSEAPSSAPTNSPAPSSHPSAVPTVSPAPSSAPTNSPAPSSHPSAVPTVSPAPSAAPTSSRTNAPSISRSHTNAPTRSHTSTPTRSHTNAPSSAPSSENIPDNKLISKTVVLLLMLDLGLDLSALPTDADERATFLSLLADAIKRTNENENSIVNIVKVGGTNVRRDLTGAGEVEIEISYPIRCIGEDGCEDMASSSSDTMVDNMNSVMSDGDEFSQILTEVSSTSNGDLSAEDTTLFNSLTLGEGGIEFEQITYGNGQEIVPANKYDPEKATNVKAGDYDLLGHCLHPNNISAADCKGVLLGIACLACAVLLGLCSVAMKKKHSQRRGRDDSVANMTAAHSLGTGEKDSEDGGIIELMENPMARNISSSSSKGGKKVKKLPEEMTDEVKESFGFQKSTWAKFYDAEHDADYYFCEETGETSWTEPDGYVVEGNSV